jgi:hypothetical protein
MSFATQHLKPDERARLVAEWQAGALGFKEMRDQYRMSGIATMTDEEVRAEQVAAVDPLAAQAP